MAIWVQIALWVASVVVSELLRPKPEFEKPRPGGLGDFNFPTAEEGRSIPVNWGYNQIRGANVTWFGDYQAIAVTDKVKTGLFSSEKITIGYKYYAGLQFVLCHKGLGAVTKIKFGEKIAWEGSAMNSTVYVDEPLLFGGDEREGGIRGYVAFQDGNNLQALDPYLDSVLTDSPAYRGVSSVIFYGPAGRTIGGGNETGYLGTTTYIKAPAFDVKRYPSLLDSGFEQVGDDANPVECLYELLVSTEWGAGMPTASLDLANFRTQAGVVHGEDNGFSMLWDRRTSIRQMIDIILDQIDGLLYINMTTGLLTLGLARNDYVAATLPVFDTSNITELESFIRGGIDTTVNEILLTYDDSSEDFKSKGVSAQNPAAWEAHEGMVSHRISMPGIRTKQLAVDVVARESRQASFTPAKLRIQTTRSLSNLYPGMPFKFAWPELGVNSVIMRISNISLGDPVDAGYQIDAIQDIFGLVSASFGLPQPSGWVPPIQAPAPLVSDEQFLFESFYWANLTYGQANPGGNYIIFAALQPAPSVTGYRLQVKPEGESSFGDRQVVNEFMPRGLMTADLVKDTGAKTGSIEVDIPVGADALSDATTVDIAAGKNLFILDNELMAFETITNNGGGSYTLGGVWRGLLDTIPENHILPVAHLHWRILVRANNGDFTNVDIAELQLRDRDGNDLTTPAEAQAGAATASSFDSSGEAYRAFNDVAGGSNVSWRSGDGHIAGEWVAYTFPVPTAVASVNMASRERFGISSFERSVRDFDIQYSDDGINWITDIAYDDQTSWVEGQFIEFALTATDQNIYFISAGADTTTDESADGETLKVRAPTISPIGTLDPALAPEASIILRGRAARPYPPGDFRIDAARYPLTISGNNDITVSWAHRDRLSADLIADDVGDVGPEAGVTYNLRYFDVLDALIIEYTGLTDTSHTFDEINLNTGDFDEDDFLPFNGTNNGSYVDSALNEIFLKVSECSFCGGNWITPILDVDDILTVSYRRTQSGTWGTDDDTNAAFYLYVFCDEATNPISYPGAFGLYSVPSSDSSLRLGLRHDDAVAASWAAGGGTATPTTHAPRDPGAFDGTVTCKVVYTNDSGNIKAELFEDDVLISSTTTDVPWNNKMTLIWHFHRQGSLTPDELIEDMALEIPLTNRHASMRIELESERGGIKSGSVHSHRFDRV